MLVISNQPRASRSSDFEFTRAITPRIVLHSVQLLLLIVNQLINIIARHRSLVDIDHCKNAPIRLEFWDRNFAKT